VTITLLLDFYVCEELEMERVEGFIQLLSNDPGDWNGDDEVLTLDGRWVPNLFTPADFN
jgi:hypothetical protein